MACFLLAGFAAISTCCRWSLLGTRLPCLLGDWVCRRLGRWAAVPAWWLLAWLACLVAGCAALSAGGRGPHGACFAWLAWWLAVRLACNLVVGFAAISTRGRWSLLGARLPCLLGDWMCRQFGWWAAVPAWWLLAWLACLVAGCAALLAGGRCVLSACLACLPGGGWIALLVCSTHWFANHFC